MAEYSQLEQFLNAFRDERWATQAAPELLSNESQISRKESCENSTLPGEKAGGLHADSSSSLAKINTRENSPVVNR